MQSKASTVKDYIDSLPEERKLAINSIRKEILKNLPKGFEETMQYGMISYVVPHKLYPSGYHCNPKEALPFISLASQKNYIALYHMMVYQGGLHDWLVKAWVKATDKKLDMGKSCIRFKKTEDIPLKLIGELCSKISVDKWIEVYEQTIKK
ncbi:MAG: DUF1801 domain-containing protein [Cyclobacteriaceae bacterium]|jgi:hypothetical protein|nr:DUF1801 domain-containing protein [Cyclobacteriaceae bacterium]